MDTKKQQVKSTDWLYLLFWAILPLIYIKTIIDYTLVPRQLFTAVFALIVLLFSWNKLFKNTSLTAPVLAYSGFLLIMTIASFGAINPIESYATLSRYGVILAYLFLTTNLLRNRSLQLTHLIKGVSIFGALAAVFALVEISRAIISGDFLTNIYTVTATFGHKNLLSSVLLLSMPFALMGSVVLNGKWKKVSLVLLFLLIAEIFILRTRGVWSSFFMASAGTILVFFTMRKNQRDAIKFPGRLVAIGGGIAVILLIAFFSASGTKSSLADSSNLSKRVVFWEHSMEMVKERPLLGVGPGNWKIYFPKYGLQGTDVSVKQGITHIQRPHNDYLWVLSEGGPLAFVLYLAVFIFTLVRLGKNLKQGNGRDEKVIDLALVFGLLAYKGFSLTDFPMERISHNLLLFTMVALAFRNSLSEKKTFNGMAPKLLVLALSVFALVVAGYRWKGERNSVDVLNGNASRNAQLMMQASAKALNPFYNMDNFANPIPYYSSVGNMVTRNYGKAWEDAQYAHDLHPNNIIVLNQVGNVLKNQGKLNEALTYYNRATEISPSLEYTRLSKAEIFLNKRQYADAMGELIWIDPQSENGKFLQLLAIVLPKFVKESAVNGRFSRIAEGIRAQQPVEPAEYITAYRITRKNLSGKP